MISRPVLALLLALAAAGCDEPTAPPVSAEDARAALAVDGLKLTGCVVDQALIIDQSIAKSIEARSAALEARTGHQLVVVTIASLNGANIAPASLLLFRRWGIGRKGLYDGVGILIAPNEHKVRIEVGKGPEAQLSDPPARASSPTRAFRGSRRAMSAAVHSL